MIYISHLIPDDELRELLLLVDMVKEIEAPNFHLCLDVGHANRFAGAVSGS